VKFADIFHVGRDVIELIELDAIVGWKKISFATIISVSFCFSGNLPAFEISESLRQPQNILNMQKDAVGYYLRNFREPKSGRGTRQFNSTPSKTQTPARVSYVVRSGNK
jgi:hypothetical protein